jgi:hypothetical protein
VEGTPYRSLLALVSGGGEQRGSRASTRGLNYSIAGGGARVAVTLPVNMAGLLLQRTTPNGKFRAAATFRKGDHP